MARKSYKKRLSHKRKHGGSNQYPAASPSSYSDSASYMKATVGNGNEQYDNVFLSNRNNSNSGNNARE